MLNAVSRHESVLEELVRLLLTSDGDVVYTSVRLIDAILRRTKGTGETVIALEECRAVEALDAVCDRASESVSGYGRGGWDNVMERSADVAAGALSSVCVWGRAGAQSLDFGEVSRLNRSGGHPQVSSARVIDFMGVWGVWGVWGSLRFVDGMMVYGRIFTGRSAVGTVTDYIVSTVNSRVPVPTCPCKRHRHSLLRGGGAEASHCWPRRRL